jgi:hypothetical protein
MVTTQETPENDQSIEIIEPETTDTGGQESAPGQEAPDTQATTTEETQASSEETRAEQVAPSPESAPEPGPQAVPQFDQREIDELNNRRAEDQNRVWKDRVARTAKSYEQQLGQAGYMPEQARDQARRYVQQEAKFRKQEQDSSEAVGMMQGKQAAAIHFMKQNGLADKQMLDDFTALQATNTPDEMEREVKRIKRERDLVSENTRLKQGRVSPQSFDNSQGAAEVTSNQDRLLDAYINGDRSEAAVKAAKRLAMGN